MTRRLLDFACRAFPRDYRARRSGELVDTALLAADGSGLHAVREALSLVVAGLRQRLRAERHRSAREGLALLAGVLALVNLAVALAGVVLRIDPFRIGVVGPAGLFFRNQYVAEWWWIAFFVAAAAIVLGLVLGNRRLALGAALANLGFVAYEAFLFSPRHQGHLNVIGFYPGRWDPYPVGREWLAPTVVLALATAGAPLRRRPLWRFAVTVAAAVLLVMVSRDIADGYFFLVWPLAATVALGMAVGWLAPRLAMVGVGISLAVAPSVVRYLTTPRYPAPVSWAVAAGLAVAVFLPLAYLTRRRLT